MKICLLLIAAVALTAVQATLPKYSFPKERCCARGHTCPYSPVKPALCKAITWPFCPHNWPIYRRCRQATQRLRNIWYRPYWDKNYMCCAVTNCPVIYFSDCSYKPDECNFKFGICTPRRYNLYRLGIACPNKSKYIIYRYLPNCCVCSHCPGKQFNIFQG